MPARSPLGTTRPRRCNTTQLCQESVLHSPAHETKPLLPPPPTQNCLAITPASAWHCSSVSHEGNVPSRGFSAANSGLTPPLFRTENRMLFTSTRIEPLGGVGLLPFLSENNALPTSNRDVPPAGGIA